MCRVYWITDDRAAGRGARSILSGKRTNIFRLPTCVSTVAFGQHNQRIRAGKLQPNVQWTDEQWIWILPSQHLRHVMSKRTLSSAVCACVSCSFTAVAGYVASIMQRQQLLTCRNFFPHVAAAQSLSEIMKDQTIYQAGTKVSWLKYAPEYFFSSTSVFKINPQTEGPGQSNVIYVFIFSLFLFRFNSV